MEARDLVNEARMELALIIAEGEFNREGLTKVFHNLKNVEKELTKEVEYSGLTELQKRIILEIERANQFNEFVYKPTLADKVGYSRTTVSHAISKLLDSGAIKIDKTKNVSGCKHYKFRIEVAS